MEAFKNFALGVDRIACHRGMMLRLCVQKPANAGRCAIFVGASRQAEYIKEPDFFGKLVRIFRYFSHLSEYKKSRIFFRFFLYSDFLVVDNLIPSPSCWVGKISFSEYRCLFLKNINANQELKTPHINTTNYRVITNL